MAGQERTQELIAKAQDGDRVAFDQAVLRYRERLEAIIRSRMGPQLRQFIDPEDILQESLLRAFASLKGFQWHDDASFFRWIVGIANHVILKAARRAKRPLKIDSQADGTAEGTSPSQGVRQQERFQRLQRALESLDPDHREVIRLARFEGLSLKEIAGRMGRTPGAVAQLLARALRKLRATFGETESYHLPAQSLYEEGGDDDRR